MTHRKETLRLDAGSFSEKEPAPQGTVSLDFLYYFVKTTGSDAGSVLPM
jgi:hypothetical protein